MEQIVALFDLLGLEQVYNRKVMSPGKSCQVNYLLINQKKHHLNTRLFLISAHFTDVDSIKSDSNKTSVIWIIVGVIVGVVAVTAAV